MKCPYKKITKTDKDLSGYRTTTTEYFADCDGKECPLYTLIQGIESHEYCERAEKEKRE